MTTILIYVIKLGENPSAPIWIIKKKQIIKQKDYLLVSQHII